MSGVGPSYDLENGLFAKARAFLAALRAIEETGVTLESFAYSLDMADCEFLAGIADALQPFLVLDMDRD